MVDGTNRLFRNNVKSKFSPQINKEPTNPKGKNTDNSSYVSSLSSPILVKMAKEVNEIFKFFKKNSTTNQKKLYAQISANSSNSSNIARETLKIKKAFPSLQNKKIEIVQKIISRNEKPKLRINMTTKELLQKQVIISIKINSANNFIKDLSTHIININRALKNIKSNIMADFICLNNKGVVIATN